MKDMDNPTLGFGHFLAQTDALGTTLLAILVLMSIASWALVSWVFGAYVATIAHYAVYYGGLAAIAVTLLWLYLTSLALLVGAEVNAHLEDAGEPLVEADNMRDHGRTAVAPS